MRRAILAWVSLLGVACAAPLPEPVAPPPPPIAAPAPPAPEVPTRIRELGWEASPRVAIGADLHVPRSFALAPPSKGEPVCGVFSIGKAPDAVVEVTQSAPGLLLEIKAPGALAVSAARVSADGSEILAGSCGSGGSPELDGGFGQPGYYALSVLDTRRGEHVPFTLLAYRAGQRVALTPPEGVAEGLSIEARALLVRYPQLIETDLEKPDLVQQLLASAPRQLFVFAARDFDATVTPHATRRSANGEVYPIALPRKNEPLLWSGDVVLTADGDRFRVDPANLTGQPALPIAIPRSVRNPRPVELDKAVPAVAALLKDEARYQVCKAKLLERLVARLGRDIKNHQAMEPVPLPPNACGITTLEERRRKLEAEVGAPVEIARSAELQHVRAHLEEIFKAGP